MAAAALAARHCRDCGWYHGFWPVVRALGCGTEPDDHASFYARALAGAAASGPIGRVLISGSADDAMPALILRLAADLGRHPTITVLDRCATPLALCRATLAAGDGMLDTVEGDALDAALEGGFDLIATHSFLGYFDEAGRAALLARWRSLLRPGGRVLTVNRIRSDGPDIVTFTEAQIEAFVARLCERHSHRRDLSALPPTEIATRARVYATRFTIRPVRSVAAIGRMAQDAGLEIEARPLGTPGRAAAGTPSGPTAPGGASYVGFVLRRPG